MASTLMILGTIIAIFGTFGALSIAPSKLNNHISINDLTHNINTKKIIIWISIIALGIGLLIAGAVMQQPEIQKHQHNRLLIRRTKMYPNLQIIAEKAKAILVKKYNINNPDIDLTCFSQTFSDTACLFRKNTSDFAGQAFTVAYITIVYEQENDIVLVFQENDPVYGLHDYNQNAFWRDVEKRNIVPLYKAYKYD